MELFTFYMNEWPSVQIFVAVCLKTLHKVLVVMGNKGFITNMRYLITSFKTFTNRKITFAAKAEGLKLNFKPLCSRLRPKKVFYVDLDWNNNIHIKTITKSVWQKYRRALKYRSPQDLKNLSMLSPSVALTTVNMYLQVCGKAAAKVSTETKKVEHISPFLRS